MEGIARQLAAYVNRTAWSDLPAAVKREAPRTLLNWFGCAFGACNSDVVIAAIKGLETAGGGPCRVLGRNEHLDPVSAALVNCLSSAVHAFDDTHLGTITHPTGPVAAASLAIAKETRPTGDEFYAALLLGMEVECRLSEALLAPPNGASIGWYITGVTGGVGAAVAAARLMKLDDARMAAAIGIAATQASGFRGTHGSMAMPMIPGFAARNGLSAALWARAGMTCMPQAIEGANGLFDVLAPKADREAVCRDLGSTFSMLQNAYKPYPCGIVVHPVVDACLEFLKSHDPKAIERIEVAVHPVGKHLGGRKRPKTEFEAQVSIPYCVALVLGEGDMQIAHLAEPYLSDPRFVQMQEHVEVSADPAIARDAAAVAFVMKDGRRVDIRIDHARGSLDRPMTDEELADKFRNQAEPAIGAGAAAKFLEIVAAAPSLNMTRLGELVDSHRPMRR